MVGERCGGLVFAAVMTSLALAGCEQAPAGSPERHVASHAPAADTPAGCVAAEPGQVASAAAADPGDRVAALEAKVLAFAKAHVGEVLGEARCSELADMALVASGARSFTDFTPPGSDEDYVWGTPVDVKDARPGDVVQFKDVEIATTTTTSGGHYHERYEAARQTAVVDENDGGAMVVFEQNVGGDPAVRRTPVFAVTGRFAHDADGKPDPKAVTEAVVHGSVLAYRPQPR